MTDSRSAGASRCSASEGSTIFGVHDKARMTPRCNATCCGLSPAFHRSPHVTKTTRCQLRSVFKWSAAARKANWPAANATAPPRKVDASSPVDCLPGHVAYLGNSWDLSWQERTRKSGLALPRHQLGINWCCLLPSLTTSGQHLRPVHASCLIAHALMPSLATTRQDRFRHSSSLVASGPDDAAGPLDHSIGDWQLWRVLQRSHLATGVSSALLTGMLPIAGLSLNVFKLARQCPAPPDIESSVRSSAATRAFTSSAKASTPPASLRLERPFS